MHADGITAVRLTLDDGPSVWTPPILDLLFDHDIQATFFVIGQRIADHEDTVERMVDEGHTVGNHTWNHKRLTDPWLDPKCVRMELADTQEAFLGLMGFPLREWRAPYFATNRWVEAVAAEYGLNPHTRADVIPDDWMRDDPDEIARRVLKGIAAGGQVVCLHDGVPPDGGSTHCTQSRQPTVDALELILEELP